MRLTCPNCGAQYEVPDEVIPDSGRDVQCSNCGDTWFQHHPDHHAPGPEADPEPTPETDTQDAPITWGDSEETPPESQPDAPDDSPSWSDPESEPDHDPDAETGLHDTTDTYAEDDAEDEAEGDTPAHTRRQLDPAIADVLREEAEHEREARAAETGGSLETQPDLGLTQDHDDEDRRSREARARMARLRGEDGDDPATETDTIDPSSRRNLLPDIDEINSSLDAGSHTPTHEPPDYDETQDQAPRKRGGFKRGFLWAVVIAVILWALYAFAPKIAEMLPALAGPLETYVEQVNALRLMLDGQFGWLRDWLQEMSSAPADTGN